MKKIILLLLSTMPSILMSMEQQSSTKPTKITAQSLRDDDICRYIDAIEKNRIKYATCLVTICKINFDDVLLYAYQHGKKKTHDMLLLKAASSKTPLSLDTTNTLTYLIKTKQFREAHHIIQAVPHTISYLYRQNNGKSLLDLIIETQYLPLIHTCISYSSPTTVRRFAHELANLLAIEFTRS